MKGGYGVGQNKVDQGAEAHYNKTKNTNTTKDYNTPKAKDVGMPKPSPDIGTPPIGKGKAN